MTRRVVVVGAESTGTTTLVRELCDGYRARGGEWAQTQWVREFGRDMSFIKLDRLRTSGFDNPTMDDLTWTTEDFVEIALEQNRLEDEAALVSGPLLLCDTDALATMVWEERYLGTHSPEVESLILHQPRALYILTSDEGVAFEADEIRDGEHLRSDMTQRFRELLRSGPTPWIELDGVNHDERVRRATAAIDALF